MATPHKLVFFNRVGFHAKTMDMFTACSTDGFIPSLAELHRMDRLVRDLHGEANANYATLNIWSKYIAIYLMRFASSVGNKYNLVDPRNLDAAYRSTFVGSPTHDANGVKGNGSSQYINTHINASSNLPSLGHASVYIHESAGHSSMALGAVNAAANGLSFSSRWGADDALVASIGGFVPDHGDTPLPSNTDGSGYYQLHRPTSTSKKIYKHGSLIATRSFTATGNPSLDIYLLARNDNGTATFFNNRTVSMVTFGSAMTDAEAACANSAVQAYVATVV
jgi:hypothetical protein